MVSSAMPWSVTLKFDYCPLLGTQLHCSWFAIFTVKRILPVLDSSIFVTHARSSSLAKALPAALDPNLFAELDGMAL